MRYFTAPTAYTLTRPIWSHDASYPEQRTVYYANEVIQAVVTRNNYGKYEAWLARMPCESEILIIASPDVAYVRMVVETAIQLLALAGKARHYVNTVE